MSCGMMAKRTSEVEDSPITIRSCLAIKLPVERWSSCSLFVVAEAATCQLYRSNYMQVEK